MKLTDRQFYSAITSTALIHVVITGDTSQNSAGSSYKVPIQQILNLVPASTGTTTGSTSNYWISGSTGSFSLKVINNTTIDATGNYALAEGNATKAIGIASHAEGSGTTALGNYSHAQGQGCIASGTSSHAEGFFTTAIGPYAHAEGDSTTAGADYSHAQGHVTKAIGLYTHSEGSSTTAIGISSHAEGGGTKSLGQYSHAGGLFSTASGSTSFVHGNNSVAIGNDTVVLGPNITGATDNVVYTAVLVPKMTAYVNDAAADADVTLPSGGLYIITGNRTVFRKP